MGRRLVGLVAAFVMLVAGCGSGDGGVVDALGLVKAAGAETTETGTARWSITASGRMTEAPERSRITGEGLFDFEGGTGTMTMEFADGAVGGGEAPEITMAFDKTTMFMKVPEDAQEEGIDTPWVSFDLRKTADAVTGVDIAASAQSGDPTQQLAMLAGVADEVETVGTEEVRGAEATHYRATIDLEQAIREAGGVTDEERFRSFVEALPEKTMEMDVWIDEEGRAVRMVFEQPAPSGDPIEMTIELFDFGTSDRPELPSPDEVTDITDKVIAGAEAAEQNAA